MPKITKLCNEVKTIKTSLDPEQAYTNYILGGDGGNISVDDFEAMMR